MKFNLNSKGGEIIYDESDWLAGLSTTAGQSTYNKMGGIASMGGANPLREYGYITASPNPTNVITNSQITAFIRKSVNIGDNAYTISNGPLIQKMTGLTAGTMNAVAPFPHTITDGHATPIGDDIVIYYTGTTQRIFYSYNDVTDWTVGIYNVVADTFDDDFMSTVPATPLAGPYITGGKGFPHPMIVGDDDILYIGDRNFVHAYDGQAGAAGTFYPAVLTLPQGLVITCFTTTQDLNLAIGTYTSTGTGTDTFYRGTAKAWFWNYLDLDPNYSRDLRDNYVSELLQWAGTTAAFTSGRKTLSDLGPYKLQALNGNNFEVIKTWNIGALPIRGGVDNVGNDLYWNSQSNIYSYTKRPDNQQYILNKLTQNQSGSSGMLRFFTQSSIIHYSYGTTISGGLVYLNGDYTDSAIILTEVANPKFNIRQKGRLKGITIAFAATWTGGRTLELVTYLDGGTTTSTTGILTSSTKTRYAQFTTNADGTPLGDFDYLQLQLAWDIGAGATVAPIIDWIKYKFELINV